AAAEQIETATSDLRWYDWERYSARQDVRMKLGGFVGRVTYRGDLQPFLPLLRLGEVVHVGKGTSFGLGKYVLEAAAPAED
ncbi:MAG: CRISPR system precrRNA processing endoribonuclease RAMP protein Cas6, partial [Deltaproteobacteria bacterium]